MVMTNSGVAFEGSSWLRIFIVSTGSKIAGASTYHLQTMVNSGDLLKKSTHQPEVSMNLADSRGKRQAPSPPFEPNCSTLSNVRAAASG